MLQDGSNYYSVLLQSGPARIADLDSEGWGDESVTRIGSGCGTGGLGRKYL